ncbi:hypothetical protein EVAR_92511_1 [Eumeta japonica]|uniref:Uncharacterized protein n=1 Tax=Eumeta variegata TaxID=151549 RepID=A0A4C1T772_EUMVA|nr:hypothetical protein EVAR_92511_1 [Eumeta japonica]
MDALPVRRGGRGRQAAGAGAVKLIGGAGPAVAKCTPHPPQSVTIISNRPISGQLDPLALRRDGSLWMLYRIYYEDCSEELSSFLLLLNSIMILFIHLASPS